MPKAPAIRRPPEQQFLSWLALAAKQTRESARASTLQVAILADLQSDATIKRFEQGKHMPVDLDTMLAAYARASNVKDARSIMELALDLWYEHGEAPRLTPRNPGDLFEQAFQPAQPVRTGPQHGHDRTVRATQKKRANG